MKKTLALLLAAAGFAHADLSCVAATSPAFQAPEEQPAAESPHAPYVKCRVMLAGDSLMESLGSGFYKEWKNHPGIQFILTARHSTGLTQPGNFHWPTRLRQLIQKYRPDVVVIFMGGNDALPISSDKKKNIEVTQPEWREVYGARVKQLCDVAKQNKCDVIWIGLPIFTGKMTNKLGAVRDAQAEACNKIGVPFVDNIKTLADENGQFQQYRQGPDGSSIRLRRKDLIHMTPEGDHLIIFNSKPAFAEWLGKFAKAHPDSCLSDEAAKKYQNPKLLAPRL